MANGESKKLAVDVIARIDKLEKGMAKAASATKTSTAQMDRSVKTARDRIEANFSGMAKSAASFAKGLAAPLLALGAAGTIRAVADIASGVARIGDEARRAGVSIEAFQELKYVAEQNRVGVDALTDGMKELALRADEFIVTGGGSAAEAFKRLGYNAEELNTKLQDPSTLFTEIIGKLGQLDQAAQIRISDELFGGTGGEQFVQLISQGEAGIQRTIAEANQLGIVLSSDVIQKAAEVDRQFNRIATTIGNGIKAALVDATYALTAFLSALKAPPSTVVAETAAEAAKLSAELQEMTSRVGSFLPGAAEDELRTMISLFVENKTSAEETKTALLDLIKVNPDFAAWGAGLTVLINQLGNVTAAAREAQAALNADTLRAMGAENYTFGDVQRLKVTKPTTVPGSGAGSGGSVDRTRAISDAARQQQAVLDLIETLEFERSTIGLSAKELAVANALRQAGSAATDQQRASIEALVAGNFSAVESNERMAESLSALSDIGENALSGLVDDLLSGKDAGEAFNDVLKDIANQLLKMAIKTAISAAFGGGGGGGFGGGGGMFGFAAGGTTGSAGFSNIERLAA